MDNDCRTSTKTNRREFLQTVAAGGGASATALLPGLPGPQISASSAYPDLAQLRAAHARKGIILPNKTYRSMEWECHTPPQADFDIDFEAAMKASRDAGAETMMLYSQDHWGYAFYPSEVAVRHPNLKGDVFGTEVALARKLGMSAVCYYSLQFNNQAIITHPDWGWVDEKGTQQEWRWMVACLDTPYRQYVLGMLNEIFARYGADELMLDIFGIQFHGYNALGRNPFCFCKYTEEAWNREHPGDDYREGFKNREGWDRRYQWHQKRTMIDMLDEVIATIRKHRPSALISLNGGPEAFPNEVMQRVSFIISEVITSQTGISLGSILMRGWGRPDYQGAIFSRNGYLDLYPGQLSRVQADGVMLQNARVFFVGNAPIVSGLDGRGYSKRWFQVANEAFADVRNVDCLLEGIQPVCSTAMLYSESTRAELAVQKRPVHFRQSNLGALETLTFAGRPVESLAEFRMTREELSKYETLVLPEVEVLSDSQTNIIRDWVSHGGTLIGTHRCGLYDQNHLTRTNFPLADVFGVDYVSEEKKYAYDQEGRLKESFTACFLESTGHPLAKLLEVSTVGLPGSFIRIKRTTANEVMRYRLPFMVEDLPHMKWFNWAPPPPGRESSGAAVTLNQFGKGQALYAGVPIFWAMKDRPFWIRRWVPDVMKQLVPKPIAEFQFEPFSEFIHGTFFYDSSKRFVLAQVLNTLEQATQGELPGAPKVNIVIDPSKLKVTGAMVVYPKTEELHVTDRAGTLRVTLPKLERYMALYLKLA